MTKTRAFLKILIPDVKQLFIIDEPIENVSLKFLVSVLLPNGQAKDEITTGIDAVHSWKKVELRINI